jgi:MFS family permease
VQFCLLIIAAGAAVYARSAISPLQESMQMALALSDNQMAMLQGPVLALPLVIASIPLGFVVDRYSRVYLVFLLALANALGIVLTAFAANFATLLLARALIGLASTATFTATMSLLADLYAPDQRGRASMAILIGQFAGMAAAFALGGALIAKSGSEAGGWRWAMCWLAGPLVPILLLLLTMREPVRTGVRVQSPAAHETVAELWQYRKVIAPLMAGLVMAEIADGAALVWAAPALSRGLGLTSDRVGAIMSITVLVGGILGSLSGGFLADFCQRIGGPRLTIRMLSGVALCAVPAGLFAVAPGTLSASALLGTFMTVIGAILVTAVALFTIVIPNELRGLCLSVMTGVNVFFGVALAPLTVSLVSGQMGGSLMIGRALALVCVIAGLLGAAMFALGGRHFPCLEARLS